jgi:hypothetical protein
MERGSRARSVRPAQSSRAIPLLLAYARSPIRHCCLEADGQLCVGCGEGILLVAR